MPETTSAADAGRSSQLTAVWALRGLWLLLPLAAGPAFAAALDPTENGFRTTASLGLWGLWALGVVATFIPLPVTLTFFRALAPAAVAAAIWAAVAAGVSGEVILALAVTLLAAGIALSPWIGGYFVNGASYGEERRLPLRPPLPVLVGPLPLAWIAAVAGVVAGPLLLADRRWVVGGIVTVIGLPLAAAAARSLYALARRFLVFVPAGFVLHDTSTLIDPVLFRRESVHFIGPALDGTDAHDATLGAGGLALEVSFVEPTKLPKRRGRNDADVLDVQALLISPTQPGEVLAEAERRGRVDGRPSQRPPARRASLLSVARYAGPATRCRGDGESHRRAGRRRPG